MTHNTRSKTELANLNNTRLQENGIEQTHDKSSDSSRMLNLSKEELIEEIIKLREENFSLKETQSFIESTN